MPHDLVGMERIWCRDKNVKHRAMKTVRPDPILKILAIVGHKPSLVYVVRLPPPPAEQSNYLKPLSGPPDWKAHHLLDKGRVQIHTPPSRD